MTRRLAQWQAGTGFQSIRADWLERAVGVGSDLVVRLPGRDIVGRFESLDERGRLLLRRPQGSIETIAAGDVFPLGTAAQSGSPGGRGTA
jgi:BirA family biotin operon repressor/biotin-[acetyl-CoA-carboxylase] ligase